MRISHPRLQDATSQLKVSVEECLPCSKIVSVRLFLSLGVSLHIVSLKGIDYVNVVLFLTCKCVYFLRCLVLLKSKMFSEMKTIVLFLINWEVICYGY